MANDDVQPLTDEEREELEQLRAQQAQIQQTMRDRQQREELERLRKAQKYAKEDAEYYAEKARRKAEREKARENPDYSVDDVPPMPLKQKVVLGVLAAMAVLLVVYLVVFNSTSDKTPATDGVAAMASSTLDAAGASEA